MLAPAIIVSNVLPYMLCLAPLKTWFHMTSDQTYKINSTSSKLHKRWSNCVRLHQVLKMVDKPMSVWFWHLHHYLIHPCFYYQDRVDVIRSTVYRCWNDRRLVANEISFILPSSNEHDEHFKAINCNECIHYFRSSVFTGPDKFTSGPWLRISCPSKVKD